jgi:diguanylate cyclase (GGDEF)-like protein
VKIDRTKSAQPVRPVGTAAYLRRAEAVAPVNAAAPVVTASVAGIPEEEFTPRVRSAIMTLMAEVDALHRELQQTKARLEEVERAADQDQLLPLLNRRAFVRELTRYIAFAGRYGTPASLIYFDLNDFKQVNDTHGHAAGDAVLQHFAATLKANVRESDIVGRLGGDEFGVILSHATATQAHAKADALAARLEAMPTPWQGGSIAVTFSYGAFQLNPGDSADLAIARADAAMYSHKKSQTRRKS